MNGITRKQLGLLHVLLTKLDVTERPHKLRVVSAILWRDVTTTNDLSRDEAGVVIDTLDSITRRDDPADYLEQLVASTERATR